MWAKKLIKKKPFKLVVVALAKKIAHRLRDPARQNDLSGKSPAYCLRLFCVEKVSAGPDAVRWSVAPIIPSRSYGRGRLHGFRINPLSCASPLGHLDSRASREPYRRHHRAHDRRNAGKNNPRTGASSRRDGYGADSGSSRADPFRPAFRPIATLAMQSAMSASRRSATFGRSRWMSVVGRLRLSDGRIGGYQA
jgi:hypothetical protein